MVSIYIFNMIYEKSARLGDVCDSRTIVVIVLYIIAMDINYIGRTVDRSGPGCPGKNVWCVSLCDAAAVCWKGPPKNKVSFSHSAATAAVARRLYIYNIICYGEREKIKASIIGIFILYIYMVTVAFYCLLRIISFPFVIYIY